MSSDRSARARLASLVRGFAELDANVHAGDPLGWEGYRDVVLQAQERTGELSSVVTGFATIGEQKVVVVAFEEAFLAGSVSAAAATKIVHAFERARWNTCPVVSLVSSGGCRMQEGVVALAMMPELAAAMADLRTAGQPHVSVVTGPTHGGIWASLVTGSDVIVGVRGVPAAFAGHRVPRPLEVAVSITTAEQHRAGQIDLLVDEAELEDRLAELVPLLAGGDGDGTAPEPPSPLGRTDLPATGWEAVQRARDPGRPRADAYLDACFPARIELTGDRCSGVDSAMRCGVGWYQGRATAFVAQAGGANTPAGFRTATRLLRLADRLGLPVLTLIDTPGASNDDAAELAGAGAAVGELLGVVAALQTPITSVVIGEGVSGGAIALAARGHTWMAPDSYFSIIGPEAATSILKRPANDVRATVEQLRLRPQDAVDLGVARGIVGVAADGGPAMQGATP